MQMWRTYDCKDRSTQKKVLQKYYFVCSNKGTEMGCPSSHLRVDYAEEDFLNFLKNFLDKTYLKDYLEEYKDKKIQK